MTEADVEAPASRAVPPTRPTRLTAFRSLPSRLLKRIRRSPGTALLFALVTIATLTPVWIGRYLPLLDYPNHLSMVFVWRHLSDPAWNFSRFYETHLVPLPYWVQYGSVYLLSIPFSVETAQKLFLSAALIGLPVAVAVYARQLGRDPRLALFVFPLGWNYNTQNGFLAYEAGTAALFFALALLDKHATEPSLRRGLCAGLAGASLYFFHILSWGTFLAVGGTTALFAPRRPGLARRLLLGPLPTLPALAVGLWAYQASSSMNVKIAPAAHGGLASLQMIFYDPAGILHNVPDWLLNLYPGSSDEAAACGLFLAWLLLLVTRPDGTPVPRMTDSRLENRGLRGVRLEVGAAVALLLLFLLPRTLFRPFYWYAINTRLALVVAIFALLCIRGPVTGARRPIFVVAALIAIGFCGDLAAHVYRFNRRAAGFDDVMAAVPAGKAVLPLMMKLGDPEWNASCYNQWGSYVQLRQGGFVPYNFEVDFPLHRKDGFPAPPWDHPELFRFSAHCLGWDYFLIHGPTASDPFSGHHDAVRQVRASGDWQLWEKLPALPALPVLPTLPLSNNPIKARP